MTFHVIFISRFVNIFISEHFRIVNVFVLRTFSHCEHFRTVNVSYYKRFRFASIFVLWIRDSLGNVSTQNEGQVSTHFLLHQTLPKLGTKIPKVGETETSDSFWDFGSRIR